MANIEIEKLDIGLPGIGSAKNGMEDYRVKIVKLDLDEPSDILTYQDLRTRGLAAQDIVIYAKEQFTFQERYFIVIEYLEKK